MVESWFEVDGAENIPVGTWLVTTESRKRKRVEVHICSAYENVIYVGGHFYFDMPKVIAYMPAPAPYQQPAVNQNGEQ